MDDLSDVQQMILAYIQEYVADNSYPPTMREIQAAVGLSGPSHVHYHMTVLERRGYIRRTRDAARGIELMDGLPDSSGKVIDLPILGAIAAGEPIDAADVRGSLQITREIANGGDFALRVKGSSMIDDHIEDGDIVIVRRQETALEGDTVVALLLNGPGDLRGEATLKRLYRESPSAEHAAGRIRLEPRNPAMQPIYAQPNDVQIQGRVVAVIRHL